MHLAVFTFLLFEGQVHHRIRALHGGTRCPPFLPPLAAFEGGHHLLHQLQFPRWGSWQPLLLVDFEVKGENFFLCSFGANKLDGR